MTDQLSATLDEQKGLRRAMTRARLQLRTTEEGASECVESPLDDVKLLRTLKSKAQHFIFRVGARIHYTPQHSSRRLGGCGDLQQAVTCLVRSTGAVLVLHS